MALYSLGGFIIESDELSIRQSINKYYLSGTLPDGIIFVDLDKILIGHPKAHELSKMIQSGRLVAINNEAIAQKFNIKYYPMSCDIIDANTIEPIAVTLDFDQFLYNAAIISKTLRNNKIRTGPGRGSSCYCKQLYNIGLTKINPDQFHLHDSRFWGYNKTKFDIDLDISPSSRKTIIDAINSGNHGFYLVKTVNKNGDIHQSTYAMVDHHSIINGNIIFGTSNNMDMVVKKFSSVPCLDLLSLHILDQLINIDWYNLSTVVVTKPLRNDVFQIGESDIAISMWNPPMSLSDISFINAVIRRKTYDNIGEPLGIDIIDNILSETYGVIVYQDQVTKLISTLLDIDMYVAESMRKMINDDHIMNMVKKLRSIGYSSGPILKFVKEIKDAIQSPIMCQAHSLCYAMIIASDVEFGRIR